MLSWQANKVATVGTRLTAQQMPLSARTDFAVLAALDEFGTMSQADLGRRLGLDRNDVSVVVTRLEADANVQRVPDPADSRRNRVVLRARGRRYLDELQERADLVQESLLARLGTREREQLRLLLDQVLDEHPGWSA